VDRVNFVPKVGLLNCDVDSHGAGQADESNDVVAAAVINITERLPGQATAIRTGLPHQQNLLGKVSRLLELSFHSELAG